MEDENKNPAAEWIGAVVVLTVIVAMAIVGVFGLEYLANLLSSDAAPAWIQAIFSVIAIFSAYFLGQRAHLQQKARDERQDAAKQLERVLVLGEIFRQAEELDEAVYNFCSKDREQNVPWGKINSYAIDQLEMIRAVPIFEMPDHDLVRYLARARQAAIAYKAVAESVRKDEPLAAAADRITLYKFSIKARQERRKAIQYCAQLAVAAQNRLDELE